MSNSRCGIISGSDQPDMQIHQFWVEVPDCIPCLEVPSQGYEVPDCIPCLEVPSQGYGPKCCCFLFVLLKSQAVINQFVGFGLFI